MRSINRPCVVAVVRVLGSINDNTGIGKKAGAFAKLQPGRARKRINAT